MACLSFYKENNRFGTHLKNVTPLYPPPPKPPPPPPHSPDLSPPDYFQFPKLKMKLKGLYFGDVVECDEAVTDELKKVQK